jgi:hypothetical protein
MVVASDALLNTLAGEIELSLKMLKNEFRKYDIPHTDPKNKEPTGKMLLQDFKNIIRSSRFLTPKEQNLVLRYQTEEIIDYRKYSEMVY